MRYLLSLIFITLFLFPSLSFGFDQGDLDKLKATNECVGCDLSGANLYRANLEGANLEGANLSKANLLDANLQGANLTSADLTLAKLRGANFNKANLEDANLRLADLYFANFSNAKLDNANFSKSNLMMAIFKEAKLKGTNFNNSKNIPKELKIILAGRNLEQLRSTKQCKMCNFAGMDLEDLDFSKADLSGANLSKANFKRANLEGANLEGANLSKANLLDANLQGANLFSADLEGANLTMANLTSANLRSAHLRGTILNGANLNKANLTSANLSLANLTSANLKKANLSDAILEGANLHNADLSSITFDPNKLKLARNIPRYIQQYWNPGFKEIKPGMTRYQIEIGHKCELHISRQAKCYDLDEVFLRGQFHNNNRETLEILFVDLGNIDDDLSSLMLGSAYFLNFVSGRYADTYQKLAKKYKLVHSFSKHEGAKFYEEEIDDLYAVFENGQVAIHIYRKKKWFSSKVYISVEYRDAETAKILLEETKPKRTSTDDF